MKIHFVFAPTLFALNHGDLGKGQDPPLGVLYLASYLRAYASQEHELRATDGLLVGYEQALREVESFDADVVCISIVTPNALGGYALGRAVRERMPGAKIVFGGPHATAFPEEPLERGEADFTVIGEGEVTFLEFVEWLSGREGSATGPEEIAGLCYRSGDVCRRTPARRFIEDLDTIPFPARDLLDLDQYRGWYLTKTGKSTSILMSRGCPFDCTYCSNNVWRQARPRYRTRSPENIIAELEVLRDEYGITEFFDNSDEFNTSPDRAKALLRAIIEADLGIWLQCQVRATPMDEELASLMRRAGVWYLHLGIESGNQRTLDGIRKKINLADVERCCGLLRAEGIKIWGLFMYFNVWEEGGELCFEGVDESLRTLEYARSLLRRGLINFFGGSITTPVPGSELWDVSKRHGLLKEGVEGNWDKWFFKREARLVSRLPGVEEHEVFRLNQRTVKYTAFTLMRHNLLRRENLSIFLYRGLYALRRLASVQIGKIKKLMFNKT